MPFAEIIEAAKVAPSLIEEGCQGRVMQGWIASKIGVRTRMRIEREIDDAETPWRKLLGE